MELLINEDIETLKKHFKRLSDDFGAKVCFKTDDLKSVDNDSEEDQNYQNIFLLHQTRNQQFLLNKYGSLIFFAEINLRSRAKIAISLFLICVRTNVDYQVVATVLCNKCNDQSKALKVKEAIMNFKRINTLWKPKYIVIDPSDSLVTAVTAAFSGIIIRQ